MNKKWIYALVAVILLAGVFYMVSERDKPEDLATEGESVEEKEEEIEEEEEIIDQEEREEIPKEEVEVNPLPENPDMDTDFADIEIGKKLPDFTLKDLEGKDVNLRELEGKIVLINFWATWCPWCDKEMADLDKLDKENDDLIVIGVNVDEPKAQVENYVRDGGYDFKVVLDQGGQLASQYLVTGLPASYFVNEEGIYAGRIPAYMTYEQMLEALQITKDF